MSGLPFRVPDARELVRDVQRAAEFAPGASIGRAYDANACLIANWICPTAGGMCAVTVRPYARFSHVPVIEVREMRSLRHDDDIVTTVYMQPDLARVARLFDRAAPPHDPVYPGPFLALIAVVLPHLLEER